MAIYIKIDNQNYKLPNRTVIGRGEPFTQFLDDRSVARVHFVLLRKKDGIYIKDLGSDTGTHIDNRRIQPKKLTKWDEGQVLKIGKSTVSLLQDVEGTDFISVGSVTGLKNQSKKTLGWYYAAMWLFLIYTQYSMLGNVKQTLLDKVMFNSLLSLAITMFVGVMYLFSSVIGRLIMKIVTPKNMRIVDVFLGTNGFTIHYDAGGNMTFNLERVAQWERFLDGVKVTTQDETYVIANLKDGDKLITYLEKSIPTKRVEVEKNKFHYLIAVFFLIGFYYQIVGHKYPVASLGLCSVFLAVAIIKYYKKFGTHKYKQNRFVTNKKIFRMLAGIVAIVSAFSYLIEPEKSELALLSQYVCNEKRSTVCLDIDYAALVDNEIDQKKIQMACQYGNKSACKRKAKMAAIERIPASTNDPDLTTPTSTD